MDTSTKAQLDSWAAATKAAKNTSVKKSRLKPKALEAHSKRHLLFVDNNSDPVDLNNARNWVTVSPKDSPTRLDFPNLRFLSGTTGKYYSPMFSVNDLKNAAALLAVIAMSDADQATLMQTCLQVFDDNQNSWLEGKHPWLNG